MCRGSGVTGTAGSLPLAGGLCHHPQLRAVGPRKAPPSAAAKRLHDDRGHAGRGGRSGTAAASAGLARRRGSQPRTSRGAPPPRVTQRREAQCSVRSRAQRRLRGREGPTLPGTPEPGRHVEMRRFPGGRAFWGRRGTPRKCTHVGDHSPGTPGSRDTRKNSRRQVIARARGNRQLTLGGTLGSRHLRNCWMEVTVSLGVRRERSCRCAAAEEKAWGVG